MNKDTLYLACTRSAQGVGGLPFGVLAGVFWFWWVGYTVVGSSDILHFRGYVWFILTPLVLLGCRFAIERDPNIFRIFRLLIDTYSIRSVLWSSPQQFPRKARMLASAI